jgi:tetratricopeptide (TPR) repeat protein
MISNTEPVNAAVTARAAAPTTGAFASRVGVWARWARSDWLISVALALVTFAVLSPALSNNFVEWDDQINLTGNEEYRGLGPAQLKYFFTTILMGHYIPLTWFTFGLDYVLWGMNPEGYHLTSLLVYAANAAVLYLVALRLLRVATTLAGVPLRLGAVAATLFFTLHPLRAESVAWATERRDVLSGLFFLLTLLTYLKMCAASGRRRSWLLGGAAGAYLLALASKGSVMVLPALLLVLDVYPLRQLSRRTLIEKIPFVVLGAAGAIATYHAQNASAFITPLQRYPLTARIGMTFYSLWFYGEKTLVPKGLGPLYELPARVNPLAWRFLGPAMAVTVITAALVLLRRRWPAGLTVWASYAIALGPVIGIVHSGLQLTHDRYSYLPALSLALMFGGLAGVAAREAAARRLRPLIAGALGVAGIAWLAGLAVLTFNQVQIWHDTEALWRFALDAEPDCVTCHSNLGIYFGNLGLNDLAREHFEQALKLRPDVVKNHYHMGFVDAASGNTAKAAEEYKIYLSRYPDDVDALNNLAAALMTMHRPEEALVQVQRALTLKPKHVFANTNLGYNLAELERRDEALKQFRYTIALKYDTPQAWFGLVRVFLETGQPDAARTAYGILGMLSPQLARQIGPALLTQW